ncbi:hypothetical protein HY003_03165 [Candidatus Saccharibacteria bacterium]|nr:hypothetical protein [Candidatus Saccharibacteria bacterium]MBI3338275.1 hypothetical protein [Candidatus Saccharibacteria bacterium]
MSFIIVTFGFVIAFGAPFLPTLKPQIAIALDLIDLKPEQTLLELGSGDGRVLVAAAERGLKVVGYEINPLLVLYSWLRTRKYGRNVRIIWGNYWNKKWPPVDGIFVFLLNRYMPKLDKKIIQESDNNVKLVSFAFIVPGRKPVKIRHGVYLYIYND